MLDYQFDPSMLDIKEQKNEDDYELILYLKNDDYLPAVHQVRTDFDKNTIHTDVLFYTHPNHEFQVIVRNDYYIDFILCLFKYKLLQSVTWK